jgi:hypothetical protein
MNVTGRRKVIKKMLAGAAVLLLPLPASAAPPPPVSITLGSRHGHATPIRCGCVHTGGGNIRVDQPSGDTVIITMSGAAVAYPTPRGTEAAWSFDLEQGFEINFDDPKVKQAKLTLDGRVIGLLRSPCKGGVASMSDATASVAGAVGCEALSLSIPGHAVTCGQNLSINDHEGPHSVVVVPGQYVLHMTFGLSAKAAKSVIPLKAVSAEFADGAIDPLWLSPKEPFHGAAKGDFGFQITLTVAPNAGGDADLAMPQKAALLED